MIALLAALALAGTPARPPDRDYFMFVEIGVDRLHHVFWQYYDPTHRKYEPGNRFETAFQDYYRMVDREIGSLLELLPDDVITILMSDHGARQMIGGVCFNDWLIREGYLTLSEPVSGPDALRPLSGNRFLQAEGTGNRVTYVDIDGDRAVITPIKTGLDSSPGVTHVGKTGYATEGKINYLFDPALRDKNPDPFLIRSFPLPD